MPDGVHARADPLPLGQAHPARCEKAGELQIVGRLGARVPIAITRSAAAKGPAGEGGLRVGQLVARWTDNPLAVGGRRRGGAARRLIAGFTEEGRRRAAGGGGRLRRVERHLQRRDGEREGREVHHRELGNRKQGGSWISSSVIQASRRNLKSLI